MFGTNWTRSYNKDLDISLTINKSKRVLALLVKFVGKDMLHECNPNDDNLKDKLFSLNKLLLKSSAKKMLS